MKSAICLLAVAFCLEAADLPITRVVIYKNGVAYFERSGEVKPGETARLEFKSAEMNDVLKSLVISDPGGAVTRVRYDLNEPLQKKLGELPVQLGPQQALAVLLDQWRGSKLEVRTGAGMQSGVIVSGRLAPLPNQGQKQELVLLADNGELQILDLAAVTSVRLLDPKLDQQFKDALLLLTQSRSREKRAVFIEGTGSTTRKLTARYLVPAPLWKSTYRLVLSPTGEPTLEGWALIDNTSGEDWNNVDLTVVSGRPVSFISNVYEPRYVERSTAELPDQRAAAPIQHEQSIMLADAAAREAQPRRKAAASNEMLRSSGGFAAAPPPPAPAMAQRVAGMVESTSVGETAEGREAGDLFEYRFPSTVSAKKGESAMIPFLQQKVEGRRLLIFSDRSSLNPRSAVELVNNSAKTLDGGPVTIYQEGAYGGEALMDTVKVGDKRLISYAVDLGTRVTTNFDSGAEIVREIKASRGVLTVRSAVEVTTTYTIANVDAREKSLLIEHGVNPNYKLLKPKADETTPQHYRFRVVLAPNGSAKLVVMEEQVLQNSIAVSSLTDDVLFNYLQSKSITPAARKQLEAIAAKKRSIAEVEQSLQQINDDMAQINKDQERIRQNLSALNRVSGQQEQVQRYAAELARQDATLAGLRDKAAAAQKQQAALESELNGLIEKLEF